VRLASPFWLTLQYTLGPNARIDACLERGYNFMKLMGKETLEESTYKE